MMKFILPLPLIILLSACASTKPAGPKIIVLDDAKYVSLCTKVAFVNAETSGFGMNYGKSPLTRAKEMAAKMGDVLVLKNYKANYLFANKIEGDVYKCPPNVAFKHVPKED